jgi:hypothetical protein
MNDSYSRLIFWINALPDLDVEVMDAPKLIATM